MFYKEELMSKDIADLVEIVRSLGIDPATISTPEEAIDTILRTQENTEVDNPRLDDDSSEGAEEVKRTRRRVLLKDTTDHVYSVTGIEGANLDSRAQKRRAKASSELFHGEPISISANHGEADPMTADTDATPFPKHRGRKSKEEIEYLARLAQEKLAARSGAAPAQTTLDNDAVTVTLDDDTTEQPRSQTDDTNRSVDAPVQTSLDAEAIVPEEAFASADNDTADDSPANLIAELQAKLNRGAGKTPDSYRPGDNYAPCQDPYDGVLWDGDPGDGTDFIIVEDIPIEDAGATMQLDIFDNPLTPHALGAFSQTPAIEPVEKFDFGEPVKAIGVVEIMPENYGFLRSSDYNYLSSPDDVFITMQTIRKLGIKTGDVLECSVYPPGTNEKYFTINEVLRVNGRDPQDIRDRVPFEHLTPLFPQEKFKLCADPNTTTLSTRIVDLFAPIGKGQRALIVAQPKTGKTMLMKDIANAIAASHPEAYLMMLLIDERPEEVTDMARTVNAEVIASTFDEPADHHVKIAGLVLEKAKRMVESGHDVVIFLDSITRLARAYNTVAPASGKILTGGVDANALQKPKRFFGAARNIEDGGSLTIIATALIDTGSKMDEVIFEEFKGTGNMELQLDRSLSNKRIFPAVNLVASSTRRDDLLQEKATLDRMWIVRKFIADMNPVEAMNEIHSRMRRTRDNEEFLLAVNS